MLIEQLIEIMPQVMLNLLKFFIFFMIFSDFSVEVFLGDKFLIHFFSDVVAHLIDCVEEF